MGVGALGTVKMLGLSEETGHCGVLRNPLGHHCVCTGTQKMIVCLLCAYPFEMLENVIINMTTLTYPIACIFIICPQSLYKCSRV